MVSFGSSLSKVVVASFTLEITSSLSLLPVGMYLAIMLSGCFLLLTLLGAVYVSSTETLFTLLGRSEPTAPSPFFLNISAATSLLY